MLLPYIRLFLVCMCFSSHARKPTTQGSAFLGTENATMNITVVDVLPDINASSPENRRGTVIASWVLFHFVRTNLDALQELEKPRMVAALRNVVADFIEVCRQAVSIADVREIIVNLPNQELSTWNDTDIADLEGNSQKPPLTFSEQNLTQLEVVYEVRVFEEMRMSSDEVKHQIDTLKKPDTLFEFRQAFIRSLEESSGLGRVMLDGVGPASGKVVSRPWLSKGDLTDCSEEVLLHTAWTSHWVIMVVASVLVVLTASSGFAVLCVNASPHIPSRINSFGRF